MAEEIVKIDKMEHSTSLRCVNQLTGRQQELYWQFVKTISRLEKEVIPCTVMTKRDCSAIFLAIALDFPEFFYWNQYEIKRVQQNEDGTVFSFEMSYHYNDRDLIRRKMNQMSAMAKDILEQIITRGMTEAEMVRAVYDFLTLNLTYTNEKYQNGNSYPYASYTLETLLNRVGVCEGISVTFLYLLRQLQIECFGYVSETHAWNVVKLGDGDQHFFCDVTWDLRERENGRRYQYYMLTERQMRAKSHPDGDGVLFPGMRAYE